ncbi:MAG: DUF4197 domain-containing protein [Desulfosarcina sp.]|nr:DUF4197 domain-containing protein [Desulfosarcina sp.]
MYVKRRLGVIIICLFLVLFLLALNPSHAGLSDFLKGAQEKLAGGTSQATDGDIIEGLKEALQIGTGKAVETVSAPDGFYNNPKIKIPLPGVVQKVEKALRLVGYGETVDAFELSMNRAAEKATPQAKALFVDSIKAMRFEDARKILNGGDNAATQYFEEKTSGRLQEMFKPIVNQTMAEVGVTKAYQDLDAKVQTIPMAGKMSFDLDQYVTDLTMSGLFTMLAEEEAKIRQNPAARTTDLLKNIFGK